MADRKPCTVYERAQLRLDAFKALEGWGTRPSGEKLQVWDLEERKRQAVFLANWAETVP